MSGTVTVPADWAASRHGPKPSRYSARVHHQVEASGHDIQVSGGAPVAVTLIMSVLVIDDHRPLVGVEGCELRLHSTTLETGQTPSQCAIRKTRSTPALAARIFGTFRWSNVVGRVGLEPTTGGL